jgi:D-alanyl-D-alanine carboxypeptidase
LNNPGLPKKKSKALPSGDDIPEAVRDAPMPSQRYQLQPKILIGGLAGLVAIAFLIGVVMSLAGTKSQVSSSAPSSPNPTASNPAAGKDYIDIEGHRHFRYQEAPASSLKTVAGNGRIKLRKPAAQKFEEMVAAARQSGVILVPISGFRSIEQQRQIFFGKRAERNQSVAQRAEFSAPPEHSEHHTGYAIDIGDGNVPALNLRHEFENSAAFKWLQANAARFAFEMSFPRNNAQGVGYEPWHWRYIGDRDSLETFYKARNR